MIAFYRSASIAQGKMGSAIAFAKEISAYIKNKNKTEILVALPVGGNPNRIGWSTQYENLGDMESKLNQLMADPKYMEMVAKGSDNFIAGSVRDEIWRTV
jgi:hypothetical protein